MKNLLALASVVLLLSGCASPLVKTQQVKNMKLPPMPVLQVYHREVFTTNNLSDSVVAPRDDRFIFKFPTIVNADYNVAYIVQESHDLKIWIDEMYVMGDGSSYQYTEHETNNMSFFRLKVDFVKK